MAGLLSRLGFGTTAEEIPEILQGDSPALQGADLAVAYFSSRVGGDFHDFLRVSPQRFLFGLLDLAGKRETSGPVLEAAQACFRASGEEIFAASELNESEAMIELSRRLNLEIMRAAGAVRSCPAFAGCYNEELGTVCYVNAGHTPGLLRDDESVVELPATGLPLGLFSLAPTDARIVGLGPRGSLDVVSGGGLTRSGGGRIEESGVWFGRGQEHLAGQTCFGERPFPAHPARRAGLHAHGSQAQRRDRTDADTRKLVLASFELRSRDSRGRLSLREFFRLASTLGLPAACGVK